MSKGVDPNREKTWKDQYEFAKPYINKFNTALDIGCDVFGWSKLMANDFLHVHAFDFRDRKQSTHLPTNIKFHCTGLDSEHGTKYTKPGVGRIKSQTQQGTSTLAVNVTTVDSFNFTSVDFIKIDCDGYEKRILEGAIDTIEKFNPVIFCELHSHSDDDSSHNLLTNWGYTMKDVWHYKGVAHDAVYVK